MKKRNPVAKLMETVLTSGARSATLYSSEAAITRVTRPMFNGKFPKGNIILIVTFGRPNFAERATIKAWKKKGKSLKSLEVELHFPPKTKKK